MSHTQAEQEALYDGVRAEAEHRADRAKFRRDLAGRLLVVAAGLPLNKGISYLQNVEMMVANSVALADLLIKKLDEVAS